ncbi:PASTA domain-containing protein [Actinokineospora pegani]
MPDLTGKTRAEAEAALRQLGWSGSLNVSEEIVTDPDEQGKVIEQGQRPGSKIDKDETINLKIGRSLITTPPSTR